jgi:hypothetical protein
MMKLIRIVTFILVLSPLMLDSVHDSTIIPDHPGTHSAVYASGNGSSGLPDRSSTHGAVYCSGIDSSGAHAAVYPGNDSTEAHRA